MTWTISLPALHETQAKIAKHPARFKVLACGRRWGKTRLGAALCIEVGLEGGRAWWVAPSYKVGNVGWRLIARLSAQIPGVEIRKGDRTITFPGGGEIAVRSADNPDSLRGEGLDLVVLDECAFIAEAAWNEALRPALSDRQGRAVFISTPKGRNWFWRLYQQGLDSNEIASWQLPTSDNPYIDPSEIEAARESLPALIFEQEYEAIFLESAGVVFRNIAANMQAPETAPESHKSHRLVVGVDWGKQADYTAVSVGCVDCMQEVTIDRFNKIDYAFQRGRLAEIARRWDVREILAESNAMGEPIIEELRRQGLPVKGFQTTATSKPPLIENLALVLEREEWQFIPADIWTGELEAYERKISPQTGRSQYSAPEGLHDDTVIARALMVRAASESVSWLAM